MRQGSQWQRGLQMLNQMPPGLLSLAILDVTSHLGSVEGYLESLYRPFAPVRRYTAFSVLRIARQFREHNDRLESPTKA